MTHHSESIDHPQGITEATIRPALAGRQTDEYRRN